MIMHAWNSLSSTDGLVEGLFGLELVLQLQDNLPGVLSTYPLLFAMP